MPSRGRAERRGSRGSATYTPTIDARDALRLLADDPSTTGLFVDFDGTIAEIVERTEDARPLPGVREILSRLARRYRIVAVVSARSLDDLRARIDPPGVVLVGSYGRERTGRPDPLPLDVDWSDVADAAVSRTAALAGVAVERKTAGTAIHYRIAPAAADAVAAIAAELAAERGLAVRFGRMVAEVVAPGPGKGEAVRELAADESLATVLYAGDDRSDAEAFDEIRRLAVRGVLVAIASSEAPAQLVDGADVVLDSPRALLELLAALPG